MSVVVPSAIFFPNTSVNPLSATVVSGFPASIEAVDRTASRENPAEFRVTVENDMLQRELFRVHATPKASWFNIDNPSFLDPGETREFNIEVAPPESAIQQNYIFRVFINAGDQTEELNSRFTIERPYDIEFTSASADRNDYRPGDEVNIEVELRNTDNKRITDYGVTAKLLNQTSEEEGLPLEAGSRARMTLSMQVPEDASPGEKEVDISVMRDGEKGQSVTKKITVESVKKVERTVENDNRLFFYFTTIEAENQGNSRVETEVNRSLPRYLSPITSFEKEPDTVEQREDTNLYTWNFDLEPGESDSVSYTISYWIPLAVLLVLLAGLLLLKKLRKPVGLKKSARETEEGIKIHIKLENMSSESVHNIEVVDFVPDVASVNENFPMAKPVIRKTSNGTRLTWSIDELEPGSQRVFEYMIKPLFEVEGEVTLPEAKLESGESEIEESGEVEVNFKPQET